MPMSSGVFRFLLRVEPAEYAVLAELVQHLVDLLTAQERDYQIIDRTDQNLSGSI